MKKSLRTLTLAALATLSASGAFAQFVSGSNGEDGALTLNENETRTIDVQEDGVHNYTTITVPAGATLRFNHNSRNTPVILLASGDVTITGTIDIAGANGLGFNDPLAGAPGSEAVPGPGGYPGGIGGIAVSDGGDGVGTSGGGPGGGEAEADPSAAPGSDRARAGNGGSHYLPGQVGPGNTNPSSPVYGDPSMLTLTGGSGGAGANYLAGPGTTFEGYGGGAGGGAICIASSGQITVNGVIAAQGGNTGGSLGTTNGGTLGAGGGAGGAIRLMANQVGGSGTLRATGGTGGANGGNGRVRIEAFQITGNIVGQTTPPPVTSTPGTVSFGPDELPNFRVVSIGGIPVPANPTGSTTSPDVILPANAPNPVQIVLAVSNIPDGAVITLRIPLENGETLEATSTPVASGNATVSVNIPPGLGVIYGRVTASVRR